MQSPVWEIELGLHWGGQVGSELTDSGEGAPPVPVNRPAVSSRGGPHSSDEQHAVGNKFAEKRLGGGQALVYL